MNGTKSNYDKNDCGKVGGCSESEPFWFFLHIPKTAGSSFRAEFAKRLQPEFNICIDYSDSRESYEELLNRAVADFLRSAASVEPQFASGHLYRSHVEVLKNRFKNLKLVTMLRDPVTRLISDYRYQRTPDHPPYKKFIEQFPTLNDYINCIPEQNKIYRHLCRFPGQSVQDVIFEVDLDFCFVGIQEYYEHSCRLVFDMIGDDATPIFYERRTLEVSDNYVDPENISRSEIEKVNLLDVEIYNYFRNKLVTNMMGSQ